MKYAISKRDVPRIWPPKSTATSRAKAFERTLKNPTWEACDSNDRGTRGYSSWL